MSSFYIAKSGKNNWRVIEEVWSKGKRAQKSVPKMAHAELGFRADMTMNEARARVEQLNKQQGIIRKKAAATARRIQNDKVIESAYLPPALVAEFLKHIRANHFGADSYQTKLTFHWNFVQKLIASLQIDAPEFADNRRHIYRYFSNRHTSPDYLRKLLRMLNLWGSFVCKKQGRHYEPVSTPRGHEKQKINESYSDSESFRGGSIPLTPLMLDKMKDKFQDLPGQYEWLYVAVWLGLRPTEIDSLRQKGTFKKEFVGDTPILWVYQSKLTSVEKSKRWKPVPLICEHQLLALKMIESKELKRPVYKTLKKISNEPKLSLYGGRKGFTDLMLNLGQRLEDISVWLGHTSIEMTWKHYKNKNIVHFLPVPSVNRKAS